MNFDGCLGLNDFQRDAILEVVNKPARLVLLILLDAGEIVTLGKAANGELEVDMLPSVQFACFLNKALLKTSTVSGIL